VAIALTRLGVEVTAIDRYEGAPAQQVAHNAVTVDMSDSEALTAALRASGAAVVIPEIEALATDALAALEEAGEVRVVPTARAVQLTMNREGIRRLAAEELGLATSPYAFAAAVRYLQHLGMENVEAWEHELGARLVGTVVPLVDVKDPTFSSGALGAGTAVEPTEGKLYAPADGKITVAFPTGHAYGLRTEDGLDLLMHIGMDTVELDGKHFEPKVAKGDTVKRGDVLGEFDIDAIKAAGYDTTTPVVVANFKKLGGVRLTDSISAPHSIPAGDDAAIVSAKA